MADCVLYSTNVFLKYLIQEKFFLDVHYVWCSESFDSATLPRYSQHALVPPSSNPADLYRQLKADVERKDTHSAKIAAQRASFIRLAHEKEKSGHINPDQRDEIIYLSEKAQLDHWRPLIYVIPRAAVAGRLRLVPIADRAGVANEYVISDLKRSEFDLIEI